jgi:hypothetical protein
VFYRITGDPNEWENYIGENTDNNRLLENVYHNTYRPLVNEIKKKVVEQSDNSDDQRNLKNFAQSLRNAVRGKVSQIQANTAIALAKNPNTWLWQSGDLVYSAKTGKTYEILDKYMDSRGVAKYFYKSTDDERGLLNAESAHKTLTKISGGQELDENLIRINSPQQAKDWIDKVYEKYPQTWQNNHVMPLGGTGDDQQFALFKLSPNPGHKNFPALLFRNQLT